MDWSTHQINCADNLIKDCGTIHAYQKGLLIVIKFIYEVAYAEFIALMYTPAVDSFWL